MGERSTPGLYQDPVRRRSTVFASIPERPPACRAMTAVNALLLTDGRLPAGGHAHSGGMERAIAAQEVTDLPSLASFLAGRLSTTGLTAAGLAAAACCGRHSWADLDAEANARTPSPALRESSRRQGRQLLRAARRLWPGPVLEDLSDAFPRGPHHAAALGAAASAARLCPQDAARCAAYGSIAGPAAAAVRLLGLDPLEVHLHLSALAPVVEELSAEAQACCEGPLRNLPCLSSVLLDLFAEQQVRAEVQLFAS